MADFLAPEAADIDPSFIADDAPWSEVTHPKIMIRSARFLSPNTVMIEGESTQYGSLIIKRTQPLLLVFKKRDGKWRIACLRMQPFIR